MSIASDKHLSQSAQDKINSITNAAQNGSISWGEANSQANSIRNGEGSSTTSDVHGNTVWNGGGSGGGGGSSWGGSSSGGGSSWGGSSGGTDYSLMLQQAMASGANAGTIEALLNARSDKIDQNASLENHRFDSVYQAAQDYMKSMGYSSVGGMGGGGMGGGSAWRPSQQQPPQYGSFQDFLGDSGYDQYAAETQRYIQDAIAKAVGGYQNQMQTANRDSDAMAQQAYIAKMVGQKNLGQQLGATGYAGGMADSQKLQTETNYQNQLTQIETQRQNTIRELESAIQAAQLTGNMQAAQELSSYLQTLQGQWNSYMQNQSQMNNANYWNQQEMDSNNYWNQQNMDNSNYWNQQNTNADKQGTATKRAMQLLAMGLMPDAGTLQEAGISTTEAALIRNQYLEQSGGMTAGGRTPSKPKSNTRGGNGGGGYDNGGLSAGQVRELQSYLGVSVDGAWGKNSKAAAGGLSAADAWNSYKRKGNEDWVRVDGIGRLSWQELEAMVDRGAVIESYDPVKKQYRYKKA